MIVRLPFSTARLPLLALAVVCMAHVGSPNTFFTGNAGPYPVRVSVRLPGVIPGLAGIAVRTPGSGPETIHSVTVQAVQFNVGDEGAPRADEAARVPGERELYAADLWFMVPTSYRVRIVVDGAQGRGTAIVPVVALATAQRDMPRQTGVVLAALGVFLGLGLITIVGSSIREGVLAVAIWGADVWWKAEAAAYKSATLFRPFAATATTRADEGGRVLTLAIRDPRWTGSPHGVTRFDALMPDHGKLMHMFLVREPALDVFAHVHPVARTPAAQDFDVAVPPIPEGHYRVYADIVHESGYVQTLVASAELPAGAADSNRDPDDSWFAGLGPAGADQVFRFADGSSIAWNVGPEPLVENAERMLAFSARDASGAPLALEPYMGMAAHVVVIRAGEDPPVFAHLHPSGSISMAALRRFEAADSPAPSAADAHAMHMSSIVSGEVAIPFAFPQAGRYRLWVQMKRGGEVVTAAFDAMVDAAK